MGRNYTGIIFLFLASVAFAQTPTVPAGAVVNGANFQQGLAVAPGSLVSIFGTDLASSQAAADSIPLSDNLGNVEVTFNGVKAPMLFVTPGTSATGSQLNVQVPWEALPAGSAGGTVSVVVKNGNTTSAPTSVSMNDFSPGIFSLEFGTGQAAAQIFQANGSVLFAAPVGSIQKVNCRPAKPGDILILYATGLGPTNPPGVTGNNSVDKARNAMTKPKVLIGGVALTPDFAGMSPQFVGVNQINVKIPTNVTIPTGDKVTLQLQVGGITTTDKVTIAVGN